MPAPGRAVEKVAFADFEVPCPPPSGSKFQPVIVTRAPEIVRELAAATEVQGNQAAIRAQSKADAQAMRFEEKMGRVAHKLHAAINAPSSVVPLNDELRGSLRGLRTRSMVKDQVLMKQFALDPRLKLKKSFE